KSTFSGMPLKAATGAVLGGGVPVGAGPYVTGPARPKAASPGNRGPAVARGGADRKAPPRAFRQRPEAPPGAPFPLGGNGKGVRRARRRKQTGRRSVG